MLLVLAGCGLKGPLALPEKPGDVTVRPGPSTPPATAPSSGPVGGDAARSDTEQPPKDSPAQGAQPVTQPAGDAPSTPPR
jgi:predicted small lipoprotein YifL